MRLLNKGADAEVARDFKEGVVPQVGGDVRVLTLPYVNRPDPTNSGPFLAELRGLVTRPREDVASMRRARRTTARPPSWATTWPAWPPASARSSPSSTASAPS